MACQMLVISRGRVVRAGLAALLRATGATVAAGEGAGSASEAIQKFGHRRPQVVLLEAGQALAEDVRLIAQAWPRAHVLVIARQLDPAALLCGLAAGALGFAVYGAEDLTRFVETVRQVGRGEPAVCADSLRHLMDAFPRQQTGSCDGALTPREREVLARMAGGMSNEAIGHDLHISIGTVKRHVSEILDKMEVRSRAEAVARFLGGPNHRAGQENPTLGPAAGGQARAVEAHRPRLALAVRHIPGEPRGTEALAKGNTHVGRTAQNR